MENRESKDNEARLKKDVAGADDVALMWEEVKREHIIQDEWLDFRRLAYRLPDGTVSEPYYTYSRRDYVVRRDCLGTLLYIQPQRLRGNSSVG